MKAEVKGNEKDGMWIYILDNKNTLLRAIEVDKDELEPILIAIEDYLESKDL